MNQHITYKVEWRVNPSRGWERYPYMPLSLMERGEDAIVAYMTHVAEDWNRDGGTWEFRIIKQTITEEIVQ